MPAPVHSLAFKQKVVDMRYEKGGMSSREIARYLNDEYKEYRGTDMTKMVVVGIWNRNPHLIRKEYLAATEEDNRVSFASIVEQYASLNKKYKKKFRLRTCLSCGKKAILEKQMFICDPCKGSKGFKSMVSGLEEHYCI